LAEEQDMLYAQDRWSLLLVFQAMDSAKAFSTMHDTHKQDYLAQAERHIAKAEDRIARQKRIIDKLVQAGQETDCAVSMLHALETCLHAFEQHRETIFERCKT
jgi:cellobiose-specific phosphotransferase system component IIA